MKTNIVDCALTSRSKGQPTLTISISNPPYLAKSFLSIVADEQLGSTLLTVIHVRAGQSVNKEFLDKTIASYQEQDDVFHADCLQSILFSGAARNEVRIDADVEEILAAWRVQNLLFAGDNELGERIPCGPYYLYAKVLFKLYKVYRDGSRAFVAATLQSDNGVCSWEELDQVAIPVPSRLYSTRSSSRPLNGVRIAVKDIFHMQGTRTSICNRAYYKFYPKREETASCLQRLVECGAQIVGKTHLSSFAWKEEPAECIEYLAPFNPRADNYQSPAGSSSGSGAAIAAYEWLDFALGTDTTGSGRRPALWNGCFAIRPSAGVLPVDGMVPTCRQFDVPSAFARNIIQLKTLLKCWYDRKLVPKSAPGLPWRVVYLSEYMDAITSEQQYQIQKFGSELGRFLGASSESMTMATKWHEDSPSEENDFNRYLEHVQAHGFYYDAYHNFDEFVSEYKQKHGYAPYASPATQWLWNIASKVSLEEHDEAMRRADVFRSWFLEKIMQVGKHNTLVLLPIEKLEPRYRDVLAKLPDSAPNGISMLYISPALGAPELVVPIGHFPYHSRITDREEHLPVAVAIMAEPEMDIRLVEVIEEFLEKSDRPLRVDAGPMMFPVARAVDKA